MKIITMSLIKKQSITKLNAQILQIFLFLLNINSCITLSLNEYITDFQPLHFDTEAIKLKHHRTKRSTETLKLDFRAYNRHFPLHLRRDNSIFSPDHMTISDDGSLKHIDTSFIYEGYVDDVPGSYAHISIIDGYPRGHVSLPNLTTYHIEPAEIYFENPEFHAVIYPEDKMNTDPFRHKRSADRLGSCGFDEAKDWMNKVAESAVSGSNRHKRETSKQRELLNEKNKYSKLANTDEKLFRSKRETLGRNNTCFLYLRSDPIMWEFVKKSKFRSELSEDRAKEEILAFFASHVSALKNIFHRTIFTTYSKDMRYNGVNFVVQRTSIMTDVNQNCGNAAATSFCNPNIDVSNFLNLNSMDNHNEFCLAYIFTHRDFTRGTLGLAWVGGRELASGGICEQHKSYEVDEETVPKSLNTGIVTTVNYGKAVPTRVSQLTFTHEVGHNFGSPHDQGTDCAPFGSDRTNAQDGNYIMFASATMGDRPNNDDFSVCSKDNITRLLHVVVNGLNKKRNCFKPSKTAFCGNGIKEEGEDCDCGYSVDCEDECCFGRDSVEGPECELRPHAKCSPTAGPCCTSKCDYVQQQQNVQCLPSDECKMASYCDGKTAECPSPRLLPNDTMCNDNAQMCHKGECVNSVCAKIGWVECFLTAGRDNEGPSREALCYVSCTNPKTNVCVSSYDMTAVNQQENSAFKKLLVEITKLRQGKPVINIVEGIQLPAGSPCDNFRGYCDVFHKCRGVDAEGPLARLKNLIFNPETLENIQQWIVTNWWAVMLMSLALVVVMGLFIKVCAVHTPSSNPRKPKARQLTLPRTLQRRSRNRGQGSGPRSLPVPSENGGGSSTGGGASSAGGRNKPTTVVIEHDPPPPYVNSASPLTAIEIVSTPSVASSSSAPMIESAGPPDINAIPPGGPKRGHGGARDRVGKGGKTKAKKNMETQKL